MTNPENQTGLPSTADCAPRGPLEFAASYLANRRPTKLVVDGVLLHAVGLVVGHVYSVFTPPDAWHGTPFASAAYLISQFAVISLLWTLFYQLSWVLVAVGCARIIANGLRPSRD